ncbi:MAG TPA: carboxypeptidase regulatory-like domain-containing protein [Acidobacteriaceae bacterium]|nr:carboxypeptidase regulatory-like domain-containing protein [Acidobacteriaceae bacterium]
MRVLRQTGVSACRTGAVCGLGLLVLWALGGTLARGQAQNTGSIYGSVTDPSGAVIPNATVQVTEPDKGISRTQKTGKTGEYTMNSLPVGVYTLTVTADGFQTFEANSITVDADKSAKIVAKMVVGNKDVTVNVDAEGVTLDTRSATIGTMIDNKLVESLPIDGNNIVALAGLLPGVTDLNAPATNTSDRGGPTYSVSGSRNTQNLMLFDGLMWNNLFYNTGINYPPPHALQEISVLLNNFKAQYGRNAGSVFNVLTKSGSNQFHFIAWDYVQNKAFNAADYLTGINPKDTSNQIGATVTGPIKRDKAYYAVTFQELIQQLEATGSVTSQGAAERGLLPNGKARPCSTNGPFAGMNCASFFDEIATRDSSGNPTFTKLTNPESISSSSGNAASPIDTENMLNSAWVQAGNTGQSPCVNDLLNAATWAAGHPYYDGTLQSTYMPNAEFPTECLNPVIQKVFNTYNPIPLIDNTGSSTVLNLPTSITTAAQPKHDANALVRVDWHVNDRHSLDARYNLIHADDETAPGVSSASQGVPTYELQDNVAVSHFGNIGDTWVLSPTLLNVFRVGYKRYTLDTPPLDNRTWNDFGGNFIEPGTPVMPELSASGSYNLGSTSQGNSHVVNENVEVLEQLQWTHGNHNYQFGVNFLRLQYLNRQDYPGQLAFSTTFTGVSLADESLGLLNSVQANSPLVQAGINHSIFTYAQDDWRATSKLTLNLGVRYELPFQWYQPTGYSSTFRPGVQSTVFPNAIAGLAFPGDKGVLNSLVPTDFNGLVPRLGLAYDVYGTGRFVLRAGFGMFFDAINANVVGVGEPFYYQVKGILPPGGASVPLGGLGPNGSLLALPSGFNKANPQFQAPYSLFYPDRNFRTPYYEAMNAGFEARVTRGGVLDVNYVGKLGRKLTIPFDQNPAIYDCTGGYFQADPQKYCKGASSSSISTKARLRYSPFNFGGGGLVDFASIGTSNYNSLQAQYTQRGGNLLTLLMSYTYSKAIDLQTQSQTTSNSIPNVFDVTSERGLSDFDARHIFSMGWLLTPPQVRNGPGIEKTLLNNWRFGGKFLTHSGKPYNVRINNDSALDGEPNQRAAIMPGRSPYLPKNRHRMDKVNEYFNVDAFTYPTVGTFSPLPRNAFIGPGYIQTDMNIGRSIPLSGVHEGMRLEVRADAFNVFNTPNLANPTATFSCSSTSIETVGGQNYGKGCRDIVSTTNNGKTTMGPIGSLNPTFGLVQSTFGNNANTSTNGRKMQFSFTVFY